MSFFKFLKCCRMPRIQMTCMCRTLTLGAPSSSYPYAQSERTQQRQAADQSDGTGARRLTHIAVTPRNLDAARRAGPIGGGAAEREKHLAAERFRRLA
eukprot:6201547-Amphidinium_carterae.1